MPCLRHLPIVVEHVLYAHSRPAPTFMGLGKGGGGGGMWPGGPNPSPQLIKLLFINLVNYSSRIQTN